WQVGALLARLARQPAAAAGLAGVLLLVLISLYTLLTIPYAEAISRWRGVQNVDYALPENALPVWWDWLNSGRMARTLRVDSRQGAARRKETALSERTRQIVLTFPIRYTYDRFPQDLAVYFYPHTSSDAHVSLVWRRPDGEEIALTSQRVRVGTAYRASLDDRLKRRLKTDYPERSLFARSDAPGIPLAGDYELEIVATLFAPDDTLEAEVLAYGEIYGLAGTDGRRRDLMTAVLWGTPIALAFGVLAALGSTLASAAIAAAAAWYGSVWDGLVERLCEVNMVLPTLAVSLMVFTLYSKSFWVILGVTVALSVLGSATRTYRAVLQQVVVSSWIEAARVQGASGGRIVWGYLLPYLAPVLVPQMVVLVPSYVFLEAALAYLGMSDPSLPTWGGLVRDAFAGDVYGGVYHLVLVPAMLLLVMAFSFGMLGRSLEGTLNQRLLDR
ncbi:MAG: ABC transporter permease, partial [Anaerolineae bacterium]